MKVNTLVEELKEQLQLEDKALQDALAGLPSQDAAGLTPAENEAVDNAAAAAQKEIADAAQCRAETVEALRGCKTALQEVHRARLAIESETPPVPAKPDSLIEARDRTKAQYTAFKAQHKLQRDAERDDRLVQGVWAAVIVVVESIINAYFYAPISDLGLLGGFFTAIIVSVINVGFAFIGGLLGLRYLGHVDPANKLGGLVAFLLCLFVCTLVVTMSALFRGHADAMSTNALDTGMLLAAAWQASVDSLMALDVSGLLASLHSFLLVFVGAICAIIGFWKGRDFDDPYPGFGKAYRQKEDAQTELDDAVAEGDERQRGWQQEHRKRLLEQSHKLDQSKSRTSAACSGLRQKMESNLHLAEDTATLAADLLSVYRQKKQTNSGGRPTKLFRRLQHRLRLLGARSRRGRQGFALLGARCARPQRQVRRGTCGNPSGHCRHSGWLGAVSDLSLRRRSSP